MINPVWQLFGFSGRMGRMAYWIGLAALIAASPFTVRTVLTADPFRDALTAIEALGWPGVFWTLALFVPLAALNTKRLHDLGRSGWEAVLFYAPAAIGTFKLFVGDTPQFQAFEAWAGWALWLTGAAGIWFLVRLGFYPGTTGPNAYGAARGSRAARLSEARA